MRGRTLVVHGSIEIGFGTPTPALCPETPGVDCLSRDQI